MRFRGFTYDSGGDTGPPVVTSYSTTFPATENPINEGGKWVRGATDGLDWTDVQTTGGAPGFAWPTMAASSAPPYIDSLAHIANWSGNDQTVTATLRLAGGTTNLEAEILLRFAITAHNARGYELDLVPTSGLHIVRWNGALNSFDDMTPSGILTNFSFADGDVWVGSISGSTITVKCNGLTVATLDVQAWAVANGGSYFATGAPGIGFWNLTGVSSNNVGWKSFSASTP